MYDFWEIKENIKKRLNFVIIKAIYFLLTVLQIEGHLFILFQTCPLTNHMLNKNVKVH